MDSAIVLEDWDRNFSAIWRELERTLRLSDAATAVLLDTSGNAVTYAGDDPDFDLSSFASLAVADYLATQEMALLLGERSMQWVVHQGVSGGLILAPLHSALILAVLFDGRTTLGLVRHQMKKDRTRLRDATAPLVRLLEQQLAREARRDDEAELGQETGDWLDRGLERLFGPTA